jgi:hypothetical protein
MTGINESRPFLSPEAANFSTFPQNVKSMISSLRILIDQLDSDFKQARELIQEIARRLDEGNLCERNQISRIVKKILNDKIQEGKITEKWIEECLSPEYKRQYTKSELSSLSKHRPKRQLIEVSAGGNQILPEQQADKGIDRLSERQLSNKMESADKLKQQNVILQEGAFKALVDENEELKEAVLRQTAILSADQVSKSELEFTVAKERYQEIENAMHKSKNLVYLIFDKSRTFLRARPDAFR